MLQEFFENQVELQVVCVRRRLRETAGGVDAFKFLLLSLGCIMLYGAAHNLFLVQQQTHIETRIIVAGAVLNVLLNIVLIPYLELTGAALSRLGAEGFILAMGLFAVAKMGIRMPARSVIRPLGAAVAMGLCLVFVGRHIHWVGSVGLGFMVYAAFLTLLRGVPRDISSYLMNMPFLSTCMTRAAPRLLAGSSESVSLGLSFA